MSREILFKGKRTGDKAWIEGFYLGGEVRDGKPAIVHYDYEGFYCEDEVDPATVCQATGLLDKNGRMIFEGDVVHCVSRTDAGEMVVIFEEGEFRMVLCENYANYSTGMGFYAIRCFSKEILSNIHDKEVRKV